VTWRYALAREILPGDIEWWTVREVYLSKRGKLKYWTADAISPGGETAKGIRKDLKMMLADSDERILDLTLDPPRLVKRK
jgi:hypothetical protein